MIKKTTRIQDIPDKVKENGLRMDYFLSQIGMSRTHFHFIRKGDRILTREYRDRINEILNTNL